MNTPGTTEDVYEAINKRWKVSHLNDISGPWRAGKPVGGRITFPFCVVVEGLNALQTVTSQSEIWQHEFSFAVFDTSETNVRKHLNAIVNAFDDAPLVLPEGTGEVMRVQRLGEQYGDSDAVSMIGSHMNSDRNIKSCAVRYSVQRTKPR